MHPVLDMTLSFEARGVVAYLLAARRLDITVQGVRDLGLGRDTAYRVCYELELRGLFRKSGKSSYNFLILESSTPELPNFGNFSLELPNFRNSGNQEDPTTLYIESSDHDQSVVEIRELPEIRKSGSQDDEPKQQALVGLSGPPPPNAAEPPAPKPPRKPKRENPPEARALYPGIFDLCKSGPSGGLANGCRLIARNLWRDFEATPEQLVGYAEWRKTLSFEATNAAKERRPMRPARPKFIYEDWREFREWWDARQASLARREEAERRRLEEQAAAAQRVETDDGAAPRLTGRELYRRTFSLPRPAVTLTD